MKLLIIVLCLLMATPVFAYRVDMVQLDTAKNVYVGQKQAVVSGTATQFSSGGITTPLKSFTIKALSTNRNNVYIGGSDSLTANNGYQLVTNASVTLDVDAMTDVYVITADDAGEGNNGVSFIATY